MEYNVSSNKINPFVRFSGFRTITTSINNLPAYAKDCRLFYFLSGTGTFVVDNVEYNISENDVFIFPPMTSYTIKNPNDLKLYIINFDYLSNNSNCEKALPISHSNEAEPLQKVVFQDISELNSPFRINISGLEFYFSKMSELYINKRLFYFREMSAYFSLAMTQIFKTIIDNNPNNKISAIKNYIDNHYTQNLTNKEIAEHFHYHPNYINRLFMRYMGISMHKYIMNFKIDKAIIMLQSEMYSVTQVAERLGYKNISQFSVHFKKATGYSPSNIVMNKIL